MLRSLARRFLPRGARRAVSRLFLDPPIGSVDFGDLRTVRPLSLSWGWDRGNPIDRHYVDAFLAEHASDIRGRGLEVKDDRYLRTYGTGLESTDVLLPVPGRNATVVADLSRPDEVPDAAFDVFVCTQTLQLVPDLPSAVLACRKVLRPGGVLLATLPGLTRTELRPEDADGDYWRFTGSTARRLFGDVFGADAVEVRQYGNILSAIAFLHGLAAGELTPEELDTHDPAYPVIVGVRASVDGAR
jgi:SAM-dependent methyltransferase